MSQPSISTLETLLARVPAFAALEPQRLSWLAARARPYHCTVGQELLRHDRLPEHWFCVIDGRGRLLHNDPGLRRPVTLAYARPGDLVGWSGLLRRSPCEWLTAATPLKLLGFEAADFYELCASSEAFAHWLATNNSPSELISTLEPSLRLRPNAEPNEREVLRQLLPHLQVIADPTLRRLPEDGAVWLWDSQTSDRSLPIGEPVDPALLAEIPAGEPLRLLRVEREPWHRLMESPAEQIIDSAGPEAALWDDDRYADLLPPPQGERIEAALFHGHALLALELAARAVGLPDIAGVRHIFVAAPRVVGRGRVLGQPIHLQLRRHRRVAHRVHQQSQPRTRFPRIGWVGCEAIGAPAQHEVEGALWAVCGRAVAQSLHVAKVDYLVLGATRGGCHLLGVDQLALAERDPLDLVPTPPVQARRTIEL